jgi:hypothetical protein
MFSRWVRSAAFRLQKRRESGKRWIVAVRSDHPWLSAA